MDRLIEGVFNERFRNQKYPLYTLALLIFALGCGIERLNHSIDAGALGKEGFLIAKLITWTSFWKTSLWLGLIFGFIKFFLQGWLFNLRVKWSEGEENLELAQHINLYTSLFYFIPLIFVATISTFLRTSPMSFEDMGMVQFLILLIIGFSGLFVSIVANYMAAIQIFSLNLLKAKIWFLVIPSIYYIVVLMNGFILLLEQ